MTFATDKRASLALLRGSHTAEIFTGDGSLTGASSRSKGTVWSNNDNSRLRALKLRSRADVGNATNDHVIGLYEVVQNTASTTEIIDVLYEENLGAAGSTGDTLFESADIDIAIPVGWFAVIITNLDGAMLSNFGPASAIPSPFDVAHVTSISDTETVPPASGDIMSDAGTDGYANHIVLSTSLYPLTDWA